MFCLNEEIMSKMKKDVQKHLVFMGCLEKQKHPEKRCLPRGRKRMSDRGGDGDCQEEQLV